MDEDRVNDEKEREGGIVVGGRLFSHLTVNEERGHRNMRRDDDVYSFVERGGRGREGDG